MFIPPLVVAVAYAVSALLSAGGLLLAFGPALRALQGTYLSLETALVGIHDVASNSEEHAKRIALSNQILMELAPNLSLDLLAETREVRDRYSRERQSHPENSRLDSQENEIREMEILRSRFAEKSGDFMKAAEELGTSAAADSLNLNQDDHGVPGFTVQSKLAVMEYRRALWGLRLAVCGLSLGAIAGIVSLNWA
ncbi:hypothetical protein [Cryobacterium aureum]|uniref:hypothetical protein n=1 Tax=Cryobacterium aureum TaxID=995037 RepID=UPI000CF3DF41|nr:hypothetical protein [Cryobacterium aureum]